MNEFITKLIERLKEQKKFHIEKESPFLEQKILTFNEAIIIVKELAEEYNNGWIPVSERLPEEEGEYLTYVNYDDDCFIAIDEFLMEGLLAGWNCTPNYRVIAWQPLPEPYKEGE